MFANYLSAFSFYDNLLIRVATKLSNALYKAPQKKLKVFNVARRTIGDPNLLQSSSLQFPFSVLKRMLKKPSWNFKIGHKERYIHFLESWRILEQLNLCEAKCSIISVCQPGQVSYQSLKRGRAARVARSDSEMTWLGHTCRKVGESAE